MRNDGKRIERTYPKRSELLPMVSGFGDKSGLGGKLCREGMYGD
jgi:hypothetical protein